MEKNESAWRGKLHTWRGMILYEMECHDDNLSDIVASTLTNEQADIDSSRSGESREASFTVWTEDRVYFPIGDDGLQWCGSVARNPDGKPTRLYEVFLQPWKPDRDDAEKDFTAEMNEQREDEARSESEELDREQGI